MPNLEAPTKPGAQEKRPIVLVKFNVSAPYTIFKTFMKDLERELSLRDVQSLSVSAGSGGSGGVFESSVFTYDVEVGTYISGEKKKTPPSSSTPPQATPSSEET
jgi:hypothetical protein